MTDRSMVWDALAFAAHDAAIHSSFHDVPDDRPSRDEIAADEHEAREAGDTLVSAGAAEIRSCHPYAFHSGEWGRLLTTVESQGRDCYLIQWPDGAEDWWPVEDAMAGYEFR